MKKASTYTPIKEKPIMLKEKETNKIQRPNSLGKKDESNSQKIKKILILKIIIPKII